jgi:hypothetical protein
MLAIITLLYREYCKARVAEMRARHLGPPSKNIA